MGGRFRCLRPLPSLRLSIYMFVVCDKGKGRPLGELKATFGTALKVLQCSKTIMSYDQSQCVLLALCVCALGRGLTEKGLGQRRGGVGSPPPSEGGPPPPPLQPPKLSNTPRGHTLAGGGPRGGRPEDGGVGTAKTVKRPPQQPAQPQCRQLLGAANGTSRHIQHSPSTPTIRLPESGNDTGRSTGRNGR